MNTDMLQRFWDKVSKPDEGCWTWTGALDPKGYGEFNVAGKQQRAHRVSWIIQSGKIPDGLCVCHHCDNPPCVRPDHLFLGTRADNARDMRRKNRDVRLYGESNPKAKLKRFQVVQIRERYASGERNYSALGREYHVSHNTIRLIVLGLMWTEIDQEA